MLAEFFGIIILSILFIIIFTAGIVSIYRGLFSNKPTEKDIQTGVCDEDGWSDDKPRINYNFVIRGLILIGLVALVAGIAIPNIIHSKSNSNMPPEKSCCTTIMCEVVTYQVQKNRLPIQPNEMAGRIDSSVLSAMHTPDYLPAKAYKGYFYCYLTQQLPNLYENLIIGVFAYPERYNKKRTKVYYRTNESGITYTAEISDLFPGIEYGDPIPFYKTLILEKDLPAAFKSY